MSLFDSAPYSVNLKRADMAHFYAATGAGEQALPILRELDANEKQFASLADLIAEVKD